jgi:hypothetical protein
MHASCCDPQNALVEEGCAIPALCHKLAAVVIHRMLWWKEGCAIPALSCMQAAVVIHRMLVEEGVCYPLRCHASCCCHDPQNALVEEGCAMRCHASSLLL